MKKPEETKRKEQLEAARKMRDLLSSVVKGNYGVWSDFINRAKEVLKEAKNADI